MTLPITGSAALWLAVVFGFVFGWLLHRGGVATYDVIVNQFRLRDFAVLKIMFTAIVVGGIGVGVLHWMGHANYHVKSANMLGVALGAAIFGVGMVVYGYCPGTSLAAAASGSMHALFGVLGMLAGGMAYAFSFTWVRDHILPVGALGKVRLSDVTGLPDWAWLAALVVIAAVVFTAVESIERRRRSAMSPA